MDSKNNQKKFQKNPLKSRFFVQWIVERVKALREPLTFSACSREKFRIISCFIPLGEWGIRKIEKIEKVKKFQKIA